MTEKIKVYQIGVGSFGRYGFEKLVEMHNHLEKVNLELAGICDIHPDRLQLAKRYAEIHEIKLETFQDVENMYRSAAKTQDKNEKVMIYDSGPSETHAEHIYKSINNDFFHLAEKPPSMKREERLHEKRLAKNKPVFWKVDFIERESPVVKKALELLDEDDTIEEIKIFRESSAGVQKIINPVHRAGVKGGDILDKMTHEIFALDFIEATGQRKNMKLENAEARYFLPFKENSDQIMTVKGSKTKDINKNTATAMTQAEFDTGKTNLKLHSSWVGLSQEAVETAQKYNHFTNEEILETEIKKEEERLFNDEEARFFVIKGSKNLLGDMMNQKIYDIDKEEELETPDLMHDQLYRVIEKAVMRAAEKKDPELTESEIDLFMNSIFNIRDEVTKPADYEVYEEIEKARQKVQKLIADTSQVESEDAKPVQT